MSINVINEKEIAVVIGDGDVGLTGMTSENGFVGLVINQMKDKVEVTESFIDPEELSERFDPEAPIATLLFTNKIALQNTINILEQIKEHCE